MCKQIIFLLAISAAITLLTLSVSAEVVASGYCVVAQTKKETNIKWTVTNEENDQILSFAIDTAATDKIQTTVINSVDMDSGSLTGYSTSKKSAWGQYMDTVTKVTIGDGITELSGGVLLLCQKVTSVAIPKSLTKFGQGSCEALTANKCFYVRGTEPVDGHMDLTYATYIAPYCFDCSKAITSVTLNPSLSCALNVESFKYLAVKEFTVPAAVPKVADKAFSYCTYMEKITFLGKDTQIASPAVFENCTSLTTIVGYVGSTAETFAKNNKYTFINYENGETVFKGTVNSVKPQTVPTEIDTSKATDFARETYLYNGSTIVDIYWLYYEDTKTIEFISMKSGYCETGSHTYTKCGAWWEKYKDKIEHAVISDNIAKVSGSCFSDCKNLVDVELGLNVTQIDTAAFLKCESLKYIYYRGGEKNEGYADFTKLSAIAYNVLNGSKITIIEAGSKIKKLDYPPAPSVQTLIAYTNDDLIEFCRNNHIDLKDATDPEKVYKFYVPFDWTLPSCGSRAVFEFNTT